MPRVLLLPLLFLVFAAGPLSAQLDTRLRISTRILPFDAPCGVEECADLTLENISAEVLIIRRFQPPQSPFSLSPTTPMNLPLTIAPGERRTFRFCFLSGFAELTNGQNNLALEIDTGDAQNRARDTIVLTGAARSGSLVIEPDFLDIGGILVGSQACRSIMLRNDGNDDLPLSLLVTPGAPFTLVPPPSGVLPPGGSLSLDVCFDPTSVGRFSDLLTLANGPCRNPVTLTVTGAGMDLAPDIGPILQISPPNLDFDTTRCGTTKCRDITIRNVGNSVSVLDNFDSLIFPFSTTYPVTPLSLPPDSAITLRVCYDPPDAPRADTQLVHFNGDSRYSLTIATVFDVSLSMDSSFGSFPNQLQKIDAARDGGRAFLGDLISDTLRGVVDTAAVYEFARVPEFRRIQDYTTDIGLLTAAVPTVAFGFGTCIFYAVDQVVADLRLQNFPGRRVIVLLTDGQNSGFCNQRSLAQIIAAAQAAGVRVYTIGIGDPGDVNDQELSDLATQTGGRYFFASDLATLLSVYQQISEDLSKGADGYFRLTGEGTAPLLEIDPPFISFDSVRVDSSRCLDVFVRNVGNALYPGGPLDGADAPFATATPLLPPLAPGDGVTLQLCFGPSRLRLHDDTIRLAYYRCGPEELMAMLDGVGYDSVVVEMRDEYTGRPGSIVEIPIHLLDPLPADYAVDTIRASVRFNKTMLAVSPDFISTDGTAAEGMAAEVESVAYRGDTAFVGLLFTGGPAESNRPAIELARLNFLVLLGNAMETDVEVYAGTFADGNPKVGRRNPATFRIDSLCYLPERLLDASARYGGRVKSVVGSTGAITVTCEISLPPELVLPLQVDLYDRTGRLVMHLGSRSVDASREVEIVGRVDHLPDGIYFVELRLGDVRNALLTHIGTGE